MVGIRGTIGVFGVNGKKSGVGGVCRPSGDGGRDLEDFLDNDVVNNLVMLFFFLSPIVDGDLWPVGDANGSPTAFIVMVSSLLDDIGQWYLQLIFWTAVPSNLG